MSFVFGSTGVQAAKAGVISTIDVEFFVMNADWQGEYFDANWPWGNEDVFSESWAPDATIADVKAHLSAKLGYPVVVLTHGCDGDGYSFIMSDSETLATYAAACGGMDLQIAAFKAHEKVDVTRLTLFGYSLGDGKSCVLWSLDGNPNSNPNTKCGGEAELVCMVRLVEKELKYDCKDGYDGLGEKIVTDPQWKIWADKFARQHDR